MPRPTMMEWKIAFKEHEIIKYFYCSAVYEDEALELFYSETHRLLGVYCPPLHISKHKFVKD